MIDVKELRIGNIFWESYGGYKEVTAINCNNVGEAKNSVMGRAIGHTISGLYSCEGINPISLTPELLLQCGFHSDNYGVFEYVKDNASYVSGCEILLWCKKVVNDEINTWQVCVGQDLSNLVDLCNLNHLHQLQNLFHLLTNKELTVNIK